MQEDFVQIFFQLESHFKQKSKLIFIYQHVKIEKSYVVITNFFCIRKGRTGSDYRFLKNSLKTE